MERATGTHTLRSDAARNRDAVIEAAIRLLTDDSHASTQAIADAAGVGRATVYRRFPTRETLMEALIAYAQEEIDQTFIPLLTHDRPVSETLPLLVAEAIRVSQRYRLLQQQDKDQGQPNDGAVEPATIAWLEGGRENGQLRRDLPAGWMLRMLQAVILSAVASVDEGEHSAEEAGELAVQTLRAMMLAPA
jgi:TetR/AcrR family transcriptional repressor of mexCD-oprJ operon